ncbi:hypothetical protein ANO11243_089910 [Dothideomycetidae sp. 11243]|nr:hypothetical protein ANO11243_089910 [fungal sp. No.11243]
MDRAIEQARKRLNNTKETAAQEGQEGPWHGSAPANAAQVAGSWRRINRHARSSGSCHPTDPSEPFGFDRNVCRKLRRLPVHYPLHTEYLETSLDLEPTCEAAKM